MEYGTTKYNIDLVESLMCHASYVRLVLVINLIRKVQMFRRPREDVRRRRVFLHPHFTFSIILYPHFTLNAANYLFKDENNVILHWKWLWDKTCDMDIHFNFLNIALVSLIWKLKRYFINDR